MAPPPSPPPPPPPPAIRREGDRHMRPGEDDSPTTAAGRGRDRGGRGRGRGRGGRGQGGRISVAGRPAKQKPKLPNDLNAPVQRLKYYTHLKHCMEYKDKCEYPSDKVYTDAEVLSLTPDDLYKWMSFRVYGTEDPNPQSKPLLRSPSVEYWKKSISYFMNTTAKWTDGVDGARGHGNATQSKRVNNLINAVKRAETRGTGQETVADRAFTIVEFRQILDLSSTRHKAMATF